jgi:hypothetical protein
LRYYTHSIIWLYYTTIENNYTLYNYCIISKCTHGLHKRFDFFPTHGLHKRFDSCPTHRLRKQFDSGNLVLYIIQFDIIRYYTVLPRSLRKFQLYKTITVGVFSLLKDYSFLLCLSKCKNNIKIYNWHLTRNEITCTIKNLLIDKKISTIINYRQKRQIKSI